MLKYKKHKLVTAFLSLTTPFAPRSIKPVSVSILLLWSWLALPVWGQTEPINADVNSQSGGETPTTIDQVQLTPWGHPNLQGIWDRRTITPLQRPDRYADQVILSPEEVAAYEQASADRDDGRPLDSPRAGISVHDPSDLDYGSSLLPTRQTSLIITPIDGKIPAYSEAAQQRLAARRQAREGRGPADSWTDRSLSERCLTWGMPDVMLPQAYNNNTQIVQTPDTVVLINEMVHDVRIIALDGRPHLPGNITQWHGDPRGHWEGNTLVVESTNFSPKASFRGAGENLHLEERFTLLTEDTLQYAFTVTDPSTWISPWTVSFPIARGDQPVYEYACHEGNYGLRNILSVARNLEKQARE